MFNRAFLVVTALVSSLAFGESSTTTVHEGAAAYTESFGVMGGLTMGSMTLSLSGTNASANFGQRTGMAGGVAFESAFSEYFSVRPELMYVQKGYNLSSKNGVENETQSYDVIELPVLLKGRIGSSSANLFVFGGPSVSLAVNKSVERNGRTSDTNPNQINSFDVGLHAGVGGELAVADNTSLFLSGRYYTGLLDISNGSPIELKNNGMLFLTGVNVGL